VIGDHNDVCGGIAAAAVPEAGDEITLDIFSVAELTRSDVNGDGEINIFDLSIVAAHYDTADPTADINEDGTVDILDLSIMARHYGQSLPGF
jgi:hypothetical protein